MKRYKIVHQTNYNFSGVVQLKPHTLRLRPREGHELRIESSNLTIVPEAKLRWHRDVEGNSVATATFSSDTDRLSIISEMTIQQFDQTPYDFLVSDHAKDYPFDYKKEDKFLLTPYMGNPAFSEQGHLTDWLSKLWQPSEQVQTYSLLERLNLYIHTTLAYQVREEPGVQSAEESLTCGSGSCRDFAYLFMEAARHLGFASRFVSGYIYSPPSVTDYGSTHAWAEVFLPGAGWKGFDPTTGCIVGPEHIAVAVARLPESVPPIAGAYVGAPGANMTVGVWVTVMY